MATNVFANGNEIASKSASGSSKLAAPDVCHTPPATASPTPAKPFPPGVPVPYPNSCHAADISNGSRTVFILGKEIALENHSYFAISEGDDAATRKLAKGIISGAVNGRCYFQTWSPNVKVEGRGVARHMDLVSHNHSNPSNTGLFPYLSNRSTARHCKKEEKRIKRACADDDSDQSKKGRRKPKRNTRGADKDAKGSPQPKWIQNHCNGLLSKKVSGSQYEDAFNEAAKEIEELKEYLTSYETYLDAAKEVVTDWAKKKLAVLTAKAAVKQGIGSFLPVVGNIAMGAHSAYELSRAYSEIDDAWERIQNLADSVDSLKGVGDRYTKLVERIDAIRNGKPLEIHGNTDSPAKVYADMQDMLAETNACLRARRCSLVPYEDDSETSPDKRREARAANKGGCCPGQTGHHLIPKGAIEAKGDGLGCPQYNEAMHSAAPTVCVEGKNQHAGSHGRIHRSVAGLQRRDKDAGTTKGLISRRPIVGADNSIEMDDLIEYGARSLQETFPLSRCSEECLLAQLRAFYKDGACKDAKGRMVDDSAKPTKPDDNEGGKL
jgi:hypothetical protein